MREFRKTGRVLSMSLYLGLCATVAPLMPANAQTYESTVNPSSDPGRVGETIRQDYLPALDDRTMSIERDELLNAPEGAENVTFVLQEIDIEGASVYESKEMESVYSEYLGQEISLATLYKIANRLTLKYRKDGYVLSQVVVPPQTIENGKPRLAAVEGYIDQIEVRGDDERSLKTIRAYAQTLKESSPVNSATLERYLLLIRDLTGTKTRSILSPSESVSGAADLLIIVDRDPYQAEVGANNFGNEFLGREQLYASHSLNSVLGMNEQIVNQILIAPDSGELELAYLYGSYKQPVGRYGSAFMISASYTDTEPGDTLDELGVEGESFYTEVKFTHPFIRSREENLYGHVQIDYRNLESESIVFDTIEDNIRMLRAGVLYEFVDRLWTPAITSVEMEVAKGITLFGASEEGDANLTRFNADPQATKLEVRFSRLQRLTDILNLQVRGEGQLSSSSLLSSEEMGVGGVIIGRGYDASEITGDEGFAGSIELQLQDPYQLSFLDTYQFYTFYDAGRVYNDGPTDSAFARESLTSAGAGFRTELLNETLDFNAFVGFPLNRDVETENDQSPRFFASISKSF